MKCENCGIEMSHIDILQSERSRVTTVHINYSGHSTLSTVIDYICQECRVAKKKDEPNSPDVALTGVSCERTVSPMCPECGGKMHIVSGTSKNGRFYKFWGCNAYPECKGIISLSSARTDWDFEDLDRYGLEPEY